MRHPLPIVLLALLCGPAARAEQYTVELHRPLKVGDTGFEAGRVVFHQKTFQTVDGRQQQVAEVNQTVDFAIDWKILEVGKHGGAAKVESAVKKLHLIGDGVDRVLVEEGVRITTRAERRRPVHEAKGQELPPEAIVVLNNMVQLEFEGMASNQEVLNPKETKKPGDTWPMNTAAMARSVKAIGIDAAEKDIKGELTLVSVKPRAGTPCMEVRYVVHFADFKIPAEPLADGLKVTKASVTMKTTTWYPLDPALQPIASESEEVSEYHFDTPQGPVRTETTVKKSWSAGTTKK